MLNIRLLCTALLMMVSIRGVARAQDARHVADAVIPSVALLMMTDGQGQPLSLGSGFVVQPGIIATNAHVIRGASGGTVKFSNGVGTGGIVGVVASDQQRDLVLLRVTSRTPKALPLAMTNRPEIGDLVYAVGNPSGLEGTFSQGIISGIRPLGSDTLLQMTAPISPGSSGGPVVNAQGEVVGVAVATLRTGQNLNFVIPARYIQLLLSKLNPPRKLATEVAAAAEGGFSSHIGNQLRDAVLITLLTWKADYSGIAWHEYGFSIRNTLDVPITRIKLGLVWWSGDGQPVHYQEKTVFATIPPGLAYRVTSLSPKEIYGLARRLEVRILDFGVAP